MRGDSTRRGKPRLAPDELARREAHAVALIVQGYRAREVMTLSGLWGHYLSALVKRKYAPADRSAIKHRTSVKRACALEMLRAGHTSYRIQTELGVSSGTIAALRREHNLPRNAPGRVTQPRVRTPEGKLEIECITRMSHAELDALERRVAADRAAGRLPPIAPCAVKSRTHS